MAIKSITLAFAALALSGCATKNFNRAPSVGIACSTIAEDKRALAETERALADKSKIGVRSIAAFALDWGIGNAREKRRAVRSIEARRIELAKAEASC